MHENPRSAARIATRPRAALAAPLAVALAAFLSACSYQTTPLAGQTGTLILTPPGAMPTVMPAGTAAGTPLAALVRPPSPIPPAPVPPAPVPPAPVPPAAIRPVSGRYAGTAVAISNPGHRCRATIPIRGWVVAGDRVTMRAFRGTIAPDGGLSMQSGNVFIEGRFDGSRFTGRYWRPGPACLYSLTVEPVA